MQATQERFPIPVSSRAGRYLLAVIMIAVLWIAASASASAQRDYVSCGHFETQADAQAVLDAGNLDDTGVQSLDYDGDGVACEDAFDAVEGPPPAYDYVSCGHFENQEGAQELLDAGTLDDLGRQSLDGDGDGIACETAFGEPAAPAATEIPVTTVVSLPNTGAGPVASTDGSGLFAIALMLGAVAALARGAMPR